MKKSLRAAVMEKNGENTEKERQSIPPDASESVDSLINKYSGMSEDGLMRELLSATGRQKAEGRFDRAALQKNVQTLLPMLDEGQKRKLFEIMKKL